ncbi:hypothetical protein PS645_01375 [Pseudomonas fluorescens]|uniref:Uncharacterized protein n=1 Tax=Pseudomonas fluorescens TaxID=294 RepID=A0A5E6R386_PSEFL|nr:hypothetical protein [Pseudomonas fluorescens]VVM63214.1 hypothetical protein PS645_01375 [Pseudomonas fluorescens]
MNRELMVIDLEHIEGQVVSETAVLDGRDMCSMNFAREEMQRLDKILLAFVVPAMGGYDNELACEIARHLEQIRTFSGNFCWKHRHVGSAWGEVGKRPGIDD